VSPAAYRTITVVTSALLAFDGAALVAASVWKGRLLLGLMGVVFLLSAALVLVSRRWYHSHLRDIAAVERAVQDEQHEMQRILRKK
jgi:hypothetical protein